MNGHIPHGQLSAAGYMQRLAKESGNDKAALALTIMSVALVATMLVNEARKMFGDHDHRGHFRERDRER